ncbi:MAG: hypothetical protein FWH40_01625 [Coriobacteriia bacterium]|nr:hypothetical protein [Coriobacteriia bacterium]
MPTLSKKENYLRLLRGEVPEYVPAMMDGSAGFGGARMGPDLGGLMGDWGDDTERKDMFGVPYVREFNANNGPIPKPGEFILEDITKWRDIIKRPAVLDNIDWQYLADTQLPNWDPDTILSGMASVGNGYFQMLVSFMGFDNGLIACFEEPDEVKDLLNFILGLNVELAKNFIYYFKPETGGGGDDIAHERAPFVSLEMFEDIFEPVWRAAIAPYVEAGCLTSHHNCGLFEPFVPHIVDMGYNAWNPAEYMNDLVGIKQRFPKLAICGGFNDDRVCKPEHTEEEIRAYVREVCDMLAPGGGYAFGGYMMGAPGDAVVAERTGWIYDEFEKIRYSYY